MINRQVVINLKSNISKYLLAFILLLGFFAIQGHANGSQVNNSSTDTEVPAKKQSVLKNCISYKRASLAFCKNVIIYFIPRENFEQLILLYNKVIINRFEHLKQLFPSYKSDANYLFIPPIYVADQDFPRIG